MRKFIFYPLVIILCCVLGVIGGDYFRPTPDSFSSRFVGRESCAECHQAQATAFHGSHHDKAMEIASDETVLGDFSDQTLEHFGVTSRMYRDGQRFMINTEGPDGQNHDYEIKYTFGYQPLQQYMVELERDTSLNEHEMGRVQVLRVSWDTLRKQWFYLTPPDAEEKLDPTDPLHWTGSTQNWNSTCAICHSTNFQKNFDLELGSYRSTFSEIDVSCEACHGPASYHIELASRRSLFWDRKHGFGLPVLKAKNNLPQIETCAPCHSRRSEIQTGFLPGCNFDDYFALQTLAQPIYHADGQIRDEDYVHGSFTQSKMFHNGVRCSDCHDVHSTQLIHSGNQVCTSCHQHPAGKYDTPNHHHHAPGTPGSNCVDCHMPHTTYMQVDARRDHSFRVPDPQLSIETGTPNACTGCHIDAAKLTDHQPKIPLRQYRDWIEVSQQGDSVVTEELDRVNQAMKRAIDSWYSDQPNVERTTYYRRLAQGLHQQQTAGQSAPNPAEAQETGSLSSDSTPIDENLDTAESALVKLAKDTSVPNLIRASAIDSLDASADADFDHAAFALLNHIDPKIVESTIGYLGRRISFVAGQRGTDLAGIRFEIQHVIRALLKTLDHRKLRIRIAAARTANNIPPAILAEYVDGRTQRALDKALTELQQSIGLNSDQAMAHAVQGSINEQIASRSGWKNLGRPPQQFDQDAIKLQSSHLKMAEQNYRDAIRVSPHVAGPRANLAALLEVQARQARSANALATIQAEIKTLRQQEHELLRTDVRRAESIVGAHVLHYRFGLSCYLQNELEDAEKHLKIALDQLPEDAVYLNTLAQFYLQFKRNDDAKGIVDRLLKLDPTNESYQQLKRLVEP